MRKEGRRFCTLSLLLQKVVAFVSLDGYYNYYHQKLNKRFPVHSGLVLWTISGLDENNHSTVAQSLWAAVTVLRTFYIISNFLSKTFFTFT